MIISKIWDEKLLQYLNSCFMIEDAGPLFGPVQNFSFARNSDLSLELKSTSDISSTCDDRRFPELKTGTVSTLDHEVVLKCQLSQRSASAYGVHSFSISEHENTPTRNRIREERCFVQRVTFSPVDESEVERLAEWVDNFDITFFRWPSSVEVEHSEQTVVNYGEGKFSIQHKAGTRGLRRGIEIKLGSITINIIPGKEASYGGPNGQATFIYEGFPNKDFREKVRNCLSLVIGVPIVSLGYVLLGRNSEHVGFQLDSPHIIDQAIFKIYALPAAPLSTAHSKLVEIDVIVQAATAYFEKYEDLNLRHICWLYWHAACSASHAKAVHIGAAIEALITTYERLHPVAYSTRIVDKSLAKMIRGAMKEALEKIDINAVQRAQIESKISNINQISLRERNDRFFEHLGLVMGSKERNAWQRRNDAAHGTPAEQNDTINLIRDISLLENLFHRVLLKLTGASFFYIDRYSEEYPVRMVTESVDAPIRRKYE